MNPKSNAVEIFPVVGKPGWRPINMECLKCSREESDAMTRIALSIFADCTNVGTPFQDSLCAIYLSGFHHGVAIMGERE